MGVRTSASASTTTCAATAPFVPTKLGEFCPSRRRSVTVLDAQLRPEWPRSTDDTSTATAAHVSRWLSTVPRTAYPYVQSRLALATRCLCSAPCNIAYSGFEAGVNEWGGYLRRSSSLFVTHIAPIFFSPSLSPLLCVTVSVNHVFLRSCPNIWPHPPLLDYHTLTKMDKKELLFFFCLFLFLPLSLSLYFLLFFFRQLFIIPSPSPDVSSAPFSGCRVAA